MGRKAKDPEVRRLEIVEAAEALFMEKGFDQTSVSDITDRVGLSHGAFFYYYKSKNDLFKAVLSHYLERAVREGRLLVDDVTIDPVKKVQILIDNSIRPCDEKDKMIEYMHEPGNAAIHDEFTRMSRELMIPMITEILEQGIREGVFEIEHPKECVELMLPMFDNLRSYLSTSGSNEEYYRKMQALDLIVARSLGIKEGTLAVKQRR